jgi:hypothetical protein
MNKQKNAYQRNSSKPSLQYGVVSIDETKVEQ